MKKIILLSIKPKIVKEIISGEKKYEFRKSFPDLKKRDDISDVIYIYESKPTMSIIGTFKVNEYFKMGFDDLMTTIDASESYKKRIEEYFNSKKTCHAMEISDLRLFRKKLKLEEIRGEICNFTPGQSYRYLPERLWEMLKHSDLEV